MQNSESNHEAAIDQEMNKRLSDYRTSRSPEKKFKAATALSLLALISSVTNNSEADRLLKLLKSIGN